MDVLVTGATGYIGGAVAAALQRAGHGVHALAHSPDAAAAIESRGWRVAPGDLRRPAALQELAMGMDAVVHAANVGGDDAARIDTAATRALLRGLEGSGRPLVYTSGAWVLGAGPSDECSVSRPAALVAWRGALEAEVLAAAPGVRAVVLRPGLVYGRGGGIAGMIARGELPVIGHGRQRWPLVHVADLAELYVRALQAPAGSVLHGVAVTLTMGELAQLAAARGADLPPSITLEEARARFGTFADALALDQCVSSRITRELLDWRVRAASPAEEFGAGSYAASQHAA